MFKPRKNRTIDNISQKDPVPITSSKSPLSTSEMITQSGSVEVAESELEFDRTCSFRNTKSNKLSIDELELTVQDIEYAESSEFPVSKTDFGIASVLLSNSNPKEPDVTDAAPTQSMSNKFLKYTFQRKRKRKLPSSPDGDSSLTMASLRFCLFEHLERLGNCVHVKRIGSCLLSHRHVGTTDLVAPTSMKVEYVKFFQLKLAREL
ncbi:hypothetical protein GH714_022151 [Hevea brasiliensis]|uniref:Uncharacterized protein n=1 Tax=Hevea brasiliensis TaxID=3981 RepID=A0A6A6MH97_HEVBR|nr:hypothetical protein GH714_022151 [Hevea brasiliensis]